MTQEKIQQHRALVAMPRYINEITSIGVVGLGYVGLPLAILAASRGFRVVGFDIDDVKVAQLARREAHFLSSEEAALFKHTPTLSVTANERDFERLDAYIICVPTPVHENHLPDLRPLESACAIVGPHIKHGTLVVIESTVSPGVCEEVALPILERSSGRSRDDFHFAHCPERINPGDKDWNVHTISRVIGARTPHDLERASKLYENLIDAEIVQMGSIKEAEAVKMVENAFRDVNIAFVNELAISFDRAGIDLVNVIRGASTKPFGFVPFYPGCGVGGHCIPVDPYYLIRYGKRNGFEHRFLIAARRVNSRMPLYAVSVLEEALKEKKKKLSGAVVAILGLAYKRDVPDVRESPAAVIHDALLRKGVAVRTFDPYVPGTTAKRLEDALSGVDAALVATDHTQFCSLTPQYFESHGVDVVVDGRNCLDKEAFMNSRILYRGIGRNA
ncbi:MAG: nucleotide sugar dehydrogenase [Patescibacteria group bacterium]|nr:nucleotide sugar dehydrogenase [Patescibacteria group bacterium]